MKQRNLRIGVDVGSTNTDGVILDPERSSQPDRGILAWKKCSTTRNPSDGINNVMTDMFRQSNVDPRDIASVTIGTTHFINAVVEMDRARLAKVAVIRLCGPFSKDIPVGVDWPAKLRDLICGHCSLVSGGLEIDGSLISDIDEEEIHQQIDVIKSKGIKSIAIIGIFSPIDVYERQEERVAEIVRKQYPAADVVTSKRVANIGFMERENASVLNASILSFARRTIQSFQNAIADLNLHCPVFVTQNDGTVLSASSAASLPIRTFSSGPTNSMRGAAFLTQRENNTKGPMIVIDIGGTTTDVGLLQANGFPRQAAAFSEIAGVRTNFSYPDVRSIGLGGGSIVRKDSHGTLLIGPESVGYQLQEKAIVFGGTVATATDYTVFADAEADIGNRSKVTNVLAEPDVLDFKAKIKIKLERIVDTMKTSPDDIPVLLVGGGSVMAPESLIGASQVIKPKWSGVANAIGAATARVSGVIDTIESTETKSATEIQEELSKKAIDKAVENGAERSTVNIVEMDRMPIQYIANKSRFIIRAVGDFDFTRREQDATVTGFRSESSHDLAEFEAFQSDQTSVAQDALPNETQERMTNVDITAYKPKVVNRGWILSEIDLAWITTGCDILGVGGGGNPYQHMLNLRAILRAGGVVRIISPFDLKDHDLVACGNGKGSPQVTVEKPFGDEQIEAQRELYKFMNVTPTAIIALEIGGGNGLQGLILGSSKMMNLPTIDGDWMGRAYPVSSQITPVVFEKKAVMVPSCISDGNGQIMFMTKADTELQVERAFRAALSMMGSHVACAKAPVTGAQTKRWVVENTISLAWRIGRAVALSRSLNQMDTIAESIIDEVGGSESAKILFKGKIVGVDRITRAGHDYGEVVIQSANVSSVIADDEGSKVAMETLRIPFKNENIMAIKADSSGSKEVIAVVPDLICVIDPHNGEAIGTPEYRYGLLVIVIGITASEKWTSTSRGIEIGGPKGFGINDIEYVPLGMFKKPRSVIDEYDTSN